MNFTTFLLASGLDWGERTTISITVSLQGILAIFGVLALLWAVIEIMHRIIMGKRKKPTHEAHTADGQTAAGGQTAMTDDMAIAAAIAASLAASEDEGAVVAAITAAISAALAEEGYTGGFRVVSFKRVGQRKARR